MLLLLIQPSVVAVEADAFVGNAGDPPVDEVGEDGELNDWRSDDEQRMMQTHQLAWLHTRIQPVIILEPV